jgi:hypothetical protein
MPLSKEALSKYPNPVFIETGLGDGDGCLIAWGLNFIRIYSIELDFGRVVSFGKKLRERNIGNIELYSGNSATILKTLLGGMQGVSITFWLDAHPTDSPLPLAKCPLLEELEVISTSGCLSTIMIDDMRLFSQADKATIEHAVLCVPGVHDIAYENSPVAPNDIMVGRRL